MDESEQKFWNAPSFADPKRPRWKVYGVSVKFDDSPIARLCAEQIEVSRQSALATLAGSMFDAKPYTPPTRLARLRSWLGWKLWRLAAWLEPDCAD